MIRLLDVVADFSKWSGMRAKLEKSVATAFGFLQRQQLPTAGRILYQGTPLVHLSAKESFAYLAVRVSILASTSRRSRRRKWQAGSSPNLAAEKTHILNHQGAGGRCQATHLSPRPDGSGDADHQQMVA
jgi:hypothetical protein